MTNGKVSLSPVGETDSAAARSAGNGEHQRWRTVLLVTAALFFCSASGIFVSRVIGFNLLQEPQLRTRPTIVQFGSVSAGTIRYVDVEIENIGGGELTIQDVKGSCDACIQVVERPNTLSGRGARGHIRFRIIVGHTSGTTRRQAIIRSNDWTNRPLILPFEWTVGTSGPESTDQSPETVSTSMRELIR